MGHIDPETLALLALGEPPEADGTAAHLRDCPECRAEFESLREVVLVGRAAAPLRGTLRPPSDAVWARIAAEVEGEVDPPVEPPAVEGEPSRRASGPAAHARRTGPAGPGAPPGRPGAARRRRLAGGISALAVLAAVIVAVLVLPARPLVEGTARLDPLEGGEPGTAVLIADRQGQAVRIEDRELSGSGGYYEVWLADPTLERLVSLGPYVPGRENRIPEGVDVSAFPVVDVSIEPVDGNPAHSGRSVLRGTL